MCMLFLCVTTLKDNFAHQAEVIPGSTPTPSTMIPEHCRVIVSYTLNSQDGGRGGLPPEWGKNKKNNKTKKTRLLSCLECGQYTSQELQNRTT